MSERVRRCFSGHWTSPPYEEVFMVFSIQILNSQEISRVYIYMYNDPELYVFNF